jgi:hypothetical protein
MNNINRYDLSRMVNKCSKKSYRSNIEVDICYAAHNTAEFSQVEDLKLENWREVK